MDSIAAWLSANWWWVAIVVGVVIQIVNAVSKHWGQHEGVKKICLFITEMLSIFTSAGARTDLGGKMKPPFVSVKPGGVK